jgi:UMF1 family MFS transporter
MDRVSSRGYALGYLGGGILLVVNAAWVLKPELFAMPGTGFAIRASFFSVAVWWAVFTVPLLRRVAEPSASGRPGELSLGAGFRRLAGTLREVRRYRQLALFLAAFWLYNDGISTIMKMATAYGDEIGIGIEHLIGALVLTQFVGFPCAVAFGRLGERIGTKRAILLGLAVYVLICLGGYFMRTPAHFYLLAGLVGTVQGGTQALSRSLFAAMVPVHKTAEMFGFFSTSAKFAGIIGPLLFGVVSQLTGQSRLSIVALVVLFILGAALLWRVDESAGVRAAHDAAL